MKPTPKGSSIRWLGAYYDAHLSIKPHAEKMASKGRKAVAGLNMLENTVQGVETKVIRRAVYAEQYTPNSIRRAVYAEQCPPVYCLYLPMLDLNGGQVGHALISMDKLFETV